MPSIQDIRENLATSETADDLASTLRGLIDFLNDVEITEDGPRVEVEDS